MDKAGEPFPGADRVETPGEHTGPQTERPQVRRLARTEARRAEVIIDGLSIACYEGETIATAILTWRSWIADDGRRRHGLFCGIGVCSECVVIADERPGVRACMTPIAPGMRITTTAGDPEDPARPR